MEKISDKVVLNKKSEEYALENIKANRFSRIIKKAIMGLTLAGGLMLAGCGKKDVPDLNLSNMGVYPETIDETEDAIIRMYEGRYETKVTDDQKQYIKLVAQWIALTDSGTTLENLGEDVNETDQMFMNNVNFCKKLLDLNNATKTLIIEDALSANEIPSGAYVKPEDCQIKYDASTQQYYIEASVKNAFSDDCIVYSTLVEDEELTDDLNYISMVTMNITDKDTTIYLDKYPTYEESAEKYTNVIMPYGNRLTNIIINYPHKDYKFSKWEVKEAENIYSKK